jgi:hypothetical protein
MVFVYKNLKTDVNTSLCASKKKLFNMHIMRSTFNFQAFCDKRSETDKTLNDKVALSCILYEVLSFFLVIPDHLLNFLCTGSKKSVVRP